MIDWIIRQLFKWKKLRLAIFDEVDLYNSVKLTLNDPEAMKTSSLMWYEPDGWRGWNYNEEQNKYYFHDIPEKFLMDIMEIISISDRV